MTFIFSGGQYRRKVFPLFDPVSQILQLLSKRSDSNYRKKKLSTEMLTELLLTVKMRSKPRTNNTDKTSQILTHSRDKTFFRELKSYMQISFQNI